MASHPLNLSEPWYIVAFRRLPEAEPYEPVVSWDRTLRAYLRGEVTFPLGFDMTLAPALPALWYCLHLPHSRFDFQSIPAKALKYFQRLHSPHRIVLMPLPWPRQPPTILQHGDPKLVIAPPDLLAEAENMAVSLRSVLEVCRSDSLTPNSLVRHWAAMRSALRVGSQRYLRPSRLVENSSKRPALLPMLWLVRQLRDGTDESVPRTFDSQDEFFTILCTARLSCLL